MEPVLGGRDDSAPATTPGSRSSRPQWSPSLADGTTLTGGSSGTSPPGRNGARPWRTGRPYLQLSQSLSGIAPQWSPSLADGTTMAPGGTGTAVTGAAMEPVLGGRDDGELCRGYRLFRVAAMEPVLGGRDDQDRQRGTAVRCGGRNGARPWRTGRPRVLQDRHVGHLGRNGARPWRTGRRRAGQARHRDLSRRNGARPWRTGRRRCS